MDDELERKKDFFMDVLFGRGRTFRSAADSSLPDEEDIGASPSPSPSSSMMQSLGGAITQIEDFFFPSDVVGGVCPRVVGEEEAIVWNAAAEACDSERVHVVWRAVDNNIWYLAVRSDSMASHTKTWCPLAALLPTSETIETLPVCYTYFGEELAVLMVVTAEELHIFRGTASVIKAKADRIVAEHEGKAQTVNIDPFLIGQMTPVPWYSVSLFEERARRILAVVSLLAALVVLGISFFVWFVSNMTTVALRHNIEETTIRTQDKARALLRQAEDLRKSSLQEQIEKFLQINDGLLPLNGFLVVYNVDDKGIRWKAVVPPSATADRISGLGAMSIETTEDGVTIENKAQVLYEQESKRRR
ncbi:MAG: hypothetical protein PHS57_07445 [Alphaproteobacteria bacterium]|nr:hypothetical protein [Alphaproteobacteria bacterium]